MKRWAEDLGVRGATEQSTGLREFYVYALVDPRGDSIFYVGKGQTERVLHDAGQVVVEDAFRDRADSEERRQSAPSLGLIALPRQNPARKRASSERLCEWREMDLFELFCVVRHLTSER